jgi:cardiolipin synthase
MIRHLPNLLSGLRVLAAPLAAWLILAGHDSAALALFAAAGFSDAADGFIARRWGFTSHFGAWLDPLADKLLMLCCFLALLWIGMTPRWLVTLVILRDLAIMAGWLLSWRLALSLPIRPLAIGKAATLVQIGYIGLMLLLLAFDLSLPNLALAAAVAAGLFTILSGAAYAGLFLRALLAPRFTGAR